MTDRYDFSNLSPIEFEGLSIDLLAAATRLRFERFAEGADGGMDGRHSKADGDIILQAKHYKGSTWSDLRAAVKKEATNVARLDPGQYYLTTSQPLTPPRKDTLAKLLGHPSVAPARIWGRTELNALLQEHPLVEKRNIKLWLSSAAVLERLLNNDIAVYALAGAGEIEHMLKVYVANPSLPASVRILEENHCLIISGPPGVGKTTLSQVLAAEHSDEGWEVVAIGSIADGFRAFNADRKQIFVFDDFLGKIRLDLAFLSRQDNSIVRFMSLVHKDKAKRFILTTRAYIWEAALTVSEVLDDTKVRVSEMVLSMSTYTREFKARILYNHLYHSAIDRMSVQALLEGDAVRRIVDHRNFMPRIIQWMTDEIGQRGVQPQDYPALFLSTLDRPDKIWEKAFRQHISDQARILLFCMFFMELDGWNKKAISLKGLVPFFERAVVAFGVTTQTALRRTMFEDGLREIKSSFALIDGDMANFINPSVQDFLSREAMDQNVLETIARALPRLKTAASFWGLIRDDVPAATKASVARVILERIIAGDVDGGLVLHQLADLIGDLILVADAGEICEALRRSTSEIYWTSEKDLPALTDKLIEGRYRHLPHACAFGRLLRRQIFRYVAGEREYAFELEELAGLARSLMSSDVELPDAFMDHFDQAVDEAVDVLSLDKIPKGEDQESTIGEWMEQIGAIEEFTPTSVSYVKKKELEDRLEQLGWAEEMRNREDWDSYRPASRSSASGGRTAGKGGFSDVELGAMFSSLKKDH
jgi:DNA polymerase III delta prime subunit